MSSLKTKYITDEEAKKNIGELKASLKKLKQGESLYTKAFSVFKYTRIEHRYLCTNLSYMLDCPNCLTRKPLTLKDTMSNCFSDEVIITEEEANALLMLSQLNK